MSKRFIFSSESVGEGHPDKVADMVFCASTFLKKAFDALRIRYIILS